ncbi:MAG TPA: low molecular weight protein-tyrosine-phosphatase [Gammaproteobacteria bacterium]|nr:low molecular weight protein-tyrosine-phosphatase [Gammaproteobacteria bacterium]
MKAFFDRFRRNREDEEGGPDADWRILFVCMGNICRSPTAEGVFRKVWQQTAPELQLLLDSAGTHGYHIGEPPDPRAQRAAARRGIDLSASRARRIGLEDFERFDLILAMDETNLEALREMCPPERHERLHLLLEFAPQTGRRDVPDPYYGGSNGFEYVLDLVEEASSGLLEHLRVRLKDTTPTE